VCPGAECLEADAEDMAHRQGKEFKEPPETKSAPGAGGGSDHQRRKTLKSGDIFNADYSGHGGQCRI